ncbi:MAG: redoxin domain-containing protein [Bryobacteraceae bacterium]
MNKLWFGCVAALLLVPAGGAQDFRVGGKVGGFTLTNLQGGPAAFSPGAVTVVLFVSTVCPVSNTYSTRMIDLYSSYSQKDVKFLFVNSNRNEAPAEIEAHARRAGYMFPVYKDVDNVVADKFGAQYTPETFVIDKTGTLRYHGRIDDAQNPARIQQHSLKQAIEAVLSGGEVNPAETRALGCTIKRARKPS